MLLNGYLYLCWFLDIWFAFHVMTPYGQSLFISLIKKGLKNERVEFLCCLTMPGLSKAIWRHTEHLHLHQGLPNWQFCTDQESLFQNTHFLLVFSNCFHSWFWGFLTFKYRVKGGTNSCNLSGILKLKAYLIFISGVVVHSACHYWLTDV